MRAVLAFVLWRALAALAAVFILAACGGRVDEYSLPAYLIAWAAVATGIILNAWGRRC